MEQRRGHRIAWAKICRAKAGRGGRSNPTPAILGNRFLEFGCASIPYLIQVGSLWLPRLPSPTHTQVALFTVFYHSNLN